MYAKSAIGVLRTENIEMMIKWNKPDDILPPVDRPVLVRIDGVVRIGELRWDCPGWEDTYDAYQYWDDPHNDGQDWEGRVTDWAYFDDETTWW